MEGAVTQTDFKEFKLYIQKEFSTIADRIETKIEAKTEKMEAKIDSQVKFFKTWVVGGMIGLIGLLGWLFDYKIDFTNEQHQANLERLNAAVFVSNHEAILRAIADLRSQLSETADTKKKKSKKSKGH